MITRRFVPYSIALSLLAVSAPVAHAAEREWSGATNTLWGTGTNWSGGTAPVDDLTTDTAKFNLASYGGNPPYQPTATSAASIRGLIFGSTSGAMTLSTGTNTSRLNVGSAGVVMESGAAAISIGGVTSTQGLQLGVNQAWTNNSSSLLTVNSLSGQTAGQNYVLTFNGSGSGGIAITGVIRNDHFEVNTGTVSLVINSTGGVTTLSGANTFTGDTTLTAGVLALNNINALGRSALNTTGAGTVTTNVTSLALGGLKGSRDLSSVITSGYSSVTLLTLNPQSGTSTYNGVISNGAATTGLTKVGAGTQVLEGANTYTGITNINAGILAVTSLGDASVASTLGASAADAANLIISGGTLQLAGATTSAQSTNRLFNVGNNGSTLDSSAGVGSSMNFTNTGTIGGAAPNGNRTLTLTGSQNGSIASVIGQRNASNSITSLLKTGSGTWTLGGANTYTGTTTVTAGTLSLNSTGSLVSTRLIVTGGTFDASAAVANLPNFTELSGAGTINAGAKTVTLAAGGILAPGNSAGQLTLQSGLDISNIADTGGLQFELGSAGMAGVDYDTISMSLSTLTMGTLNFADFTFTPLTGFGAGIYTLFDAGSIVGSIGTATGTIGGFDGTLSISGNNLVLTVIPEPAGWMLLTVSLLGLVALRKRRSLR